MLSGNYKTYTVGHFVAERFETAQVFARHGIDFCCHGNVPFEEACQKRNVNPETVARELDSLAGTALAPTHINLLDGTIEGVACAQERVFGVQYHPESAPGPQDSGYLFDRFIRLMEEGKDNA